MKTVGESSTEYYPALWDSEMLVADTVNLSVFSSVAQWKKANTGREKEKKKTLNILVYLLSPGATFRFQFR